MTDIVTYPTVLKVTKSWSKFKLADQARPGQGIVSRLLELEPEARSVFRFEKEKDLTTIPKFAVHARAFSDHIDLIVGLLGPDLEPLEEDLIDLGRRHTRRGVHVAYLQSMQRSVLDNMSLKLGNDFSEDDRDAWKAVFKFVTTHMIKGMMEAL
jgi:hemoglobin-like flavoprotein